MDPHAENAFDTTIHLTPQDVLISEKFMKITLKWSKTIQSRDKVHVVVVPRLRSRLTCPVKAMQEAIAMYNPSPTSPFFQIFVGNKWKVLIDSRIRKVLAKINIKMGLTSNYFPFHTFRRSGATLAYNAHMPIQSIQHHGSWASDCVWTYIQKNNSHSRQIAASFAKMLDNV